MPFYFDRLLGGIFFDENYRYDMALVNEVKERFGDSFFGFQIHEWGSNYLNDWLRLQNTPIDEWTPKGIREGLCRKHGGAFPWLNHIRVLNLLRCVSRKTLLNLFSI